MSNGARHGLGAVVGLIATPVLAGTLMLGLERAARYARTLELMSLERTAGLALLVAAAALVGLLAGSRLSPLASLIPGAAFSLHGLAWLLSPTIMLDILDLLPKPLNRGYLLLEPQGVGTLVGVALLVASFPPSRWRSGRTGPPPAAPPHAAMAPQGAVPPLADPGSPDRPERPAMPFGPPPAGPPRSEPGQGTPPYPPRPPGRRDGDDDDDGPGEWTRIYGGR
ncbi:hypothetical protein [Actinomadura kijaniata]|uniref:hypothetical protein n=1 Tax=Actinomadura kijaniata TaxID=46161 RepID=UPI00082FE353|nr:hypothetical protein [Actinomadura kijaniata]